MPIFFLHGIWRPDDILSKITAGIFLILIANSESSPEGCFVRDSFISRRLLNRTQLAEWIQRQLGILPIKCDHIWILYAKSCGGQNVSTGVWICIIWSVAWAKNLSFCYSGWKKKTHNKLDVECFKWHWTSRVSTACKELEGASEALWPLEDRQIAREHVC